MARWIVAIIAVAVAAGAGFLAGYVHWGRQASQVEQLQRLMQSEDSEASALRTEKRQLEERIEQVAKEQERLARENEVLRKEETKQQLLGGPGGTLPVLPPK